MHIHGTEHELKSNMVFKNAEKKCYLSAVFIQPDCTHFATVDQSNAIEIFSVKSKDEVNCEILYQLNVETEEWV